MSETEGTPFPRASEVPKLRRRSQKCDAKEAPKGRGKSEEKSFEKLGNFLANFFRPLTYLSKFNR